MDEKHIEYEVAYLMAHKDALLADFEAAGVRTTCLGARGSADPGWVPQLRRLLMDRRADIVHAHSPVAAAGARLAIRTIPRRLRPRMVTTEHNVWPSHARLTRLADAATARVDDAHLAVSAAVRASLPHWLRTRTEVVRHGIDVDAVAAYRSDRDAVRKELALEGRLVVGTVANLRRTKGWPDLLEAASRVVDATDRATFVAVGQGPMEDEIRAMHRRLHLGERFRLLGFRADAVRVMAAFDVFCLPSHHEGLPVSLMEAMALGLPIVATDVGGVRELVVDRVHGRLVAPGRPIALADAIMALLSDEQARKEAADAVAGATSELEAGRSLRRIEAIYDGLARP